MKIILDQQMIPIKTLGRNTKTDCIQLNRQVVVLIILVILYGFNGVNVARFWYRRDCRMTSVGGGYGLPSDRHSNIWLHNEPN